MSLEFCKQISANFTPPVHDLFSSLLKALSRSGDDHCCKTRFESIRTKNLLSLSKKKNS